MAEDENNLLTEKIIGFAIEIPRQLKKGLRRLPLGE
jgi:hypothetical protein